MLNLITLSVPLPWFTRTGQRYRTAMNPNQFLTIDPIAYPLALGSNINRIPVKGWLSQGKEYAFQGHNVEHFGLEGDFTPTNVEVDRGNYIVHNGSRHYILLKEGITITTTSDGRGDMCFFSHSGDNFWTYAHHGFGGGGKDYKTTVEVQTLIFQGSQVIRKGYTRVTYTYTTSDSHRDWSNEQLVETFVDAVKNITYPVISTGQGWSRLNTLNFGLFSVDPDDVATLAKHFVKRESRHQLVRSTAWSLANNAWASCAKTCCDGQRRFDGNALNWISKLTSWGGEIRQSLNLIDNLSNPKEWASTWLSFRFGSRLEWKTSNDVLDAIWDEFLTIKKHTKYSRFRVSRSRTTLITPWDEPLDVNMRLVCSNDSMNRLMTSVKTAMDWGYWPSLVNTFDLIPFSFVADWLSNVSAVLDNVDDMIYRQYLKVELCEQSIKTKIPVTLADSDRFTSNENVFMTYYSRKGSKKLPEFGVLEGYEPSLPSLVNFVDSVSLLVQLRG